MNRWCNLPSEIIGNVFERLEHNDLLQCSLTCRRWKSAAQRVLFKSLPRLTEEQMSALITALSMYQGDRAKESPGNFVKSLDSFELSDNFNVESLDKAFPFVKSIHIGWDKCADKITFSDKLYGLIMNGKFSNLNCIPLLSVDECYRKLLLSRKESIVVLKLQQQGHDDIIVEEILSELHLFSKLKQLTMNFRGMLQEATCLECFLPGDHPTLTSIIIKYNNSKFCLDTSYFDMNNIQPLTNVSELVIHNHELFRGDECYVYVMKKFPNLDKIILERNEKDIIEVQKYKAPTVNCILQFLIYLFNIKKSTASSIVTDQFTTEIIERFLNHALESNRTLKCIDIHLNIHFHESDEFEIFSEGCTVFITADNEYRKGKRICKMGVLYNTTAEMNVETAQLELYKRIGGMDVASLSIGDRYEGIQTLYRAKLSLDAVLDHCTNIKTLELYEIEDFDNEKKETPQIHTALETIRLYNCFLRQDTYCKIAQRCPSLKYFEICCMHNMYCTPGSKLMTPTNYCRIHMQSTRLEELKFKMTSESDKVLDEYRTLFFKLTTDAEETRYAKIQTPRDEKRIYLVDSCTENDYDLCVNANDTETLIIDMCFQTVTTFIIETEVPNKFEKTLIICK